MAYRKYLSRNPDENLNTLKEEILLGNADAIKPYIILLNRMEPTSLPAFPLMDFEFSKIFFEEDPILVINYLNLDINGKNVIKKLWDTRNKEIIKIYLKDSYSMIRKADSFSPVHNKIESFINELDFEDGFASNENWGESARLFEFTSDITKEINEISLQLTKENLTAEEIELIINSKGAIVHNSGDGFIRVDFYEKHRGLIRAWNDIERSFEAADEDNDEDNEEAGD